VGQSTLVGDQIADGRRFVERFAADGNPVRAAFWAKSDGNDLWLLHLATDLVDRVGPAASFRAVDASLEKLGDPSTSALDINVISPGDPLAKDVLARMAGNPRRPATQFGDFGYGPVTFEVGYVYPDRLFRFVRPDQMTTEELGREILHLLSRGPGIALPSSVFLQDGTTFDGAPVLLQVGDEGSMRVMFSVDRELAPRTIELDAISSIVR